jgi:hypothetical protein
METEPRDTETDDDAGGDENADTPPPLPAEDDDSALGDTDQHSGADA